MTRSQGLVFIRDADREPGGGEGRELRAQASWAADREQGTAELTQGQWRNRLTVGLQRHGPTKGQTRQWPNHEESVYDAGAGEWFTRTPNAGADGSSQRI